MSILAVCLNYHCSMATYVSWVYIVKKHKSSYMGEIGRDDMSCRQTHAVIFYIFFTPGVVLSTTP